MTDQPLRVCGYCRCSTDTQDDSLDTQESIIRAECERQGYQLVQVFADPAVSASVPIEHRPQGAKLMSLVAAKDRPFDAVIVLRLDRLFRDPQDELGGLGYLAQHRCELISIKDPIDRSTPAGELYHGIGMHVRAFERRQTGQRIKEHNQGLAMRGQWPAGLPPLGYSYDPETKTISVNDRAEDAIRAFELYCATGNACETARQLNGLGVRTRTGGGWNDEGVLAIIKNPCYRRRIQYDGKQFDGTALIPELIPADLLARTDALLANLAPFRTRARGGVYAYSSLLYCSQCGERMRSKGNGAWICRTKKETGLCNSRSVSERYIDALVGQAIGQVFTRYRDELSAMKPERTPARRSHSTQRKRLADRRTRVLDLYVRGVINEAERDAYLEQIRAELEQLEAERPAPTFTAEMVQSMIELVPAEWPRMPQDKRRGLLLAFGAKLTLCTNRESVLWVTLETSFMEAITVKAKERNR